MKDWRAFQKEFVLRKGRVDDLAEHEEYDLLIAQLPEYWSNEVAKEQAKKNSGSRWAKITNLPDVTRDELEETLLGIGCRPKRIRKVENGFLVKCFEDDDQNKLLRLDGGKMAGHRVKVMRTKVKLTSEEIFRFVADRLQTMEDAMDLRRTLLADPKATPKDEWTVRKVEIMDNQLQTKETESIVEATTSPRLTAPGTTTNPYAAALSTPPSRGVAQTSSQNFGGKGGKGKGGVTSSMPNWYQAPYWTNPQMMGNMFTSPGGKGSFPQAWPQTWRGPAIPDPSIVHQGGQLTPPTPSMVGKGQGKGRGKGAALGGSDQGMLEEKHTRENQHQNTPPSPRRQSGGRGKGAQSPIEEPSSMSECQTCRMAGREFNHRWEECRAEEHSQRLQQ